MGCGGSKSIGEELDEVCQAVVNGEGVAGYIVAGAGTKHVDGTYLRDGTYKGAPVFKNGQVWLVRWSDDDWYLADKDKLDSAVGDFYSVEDDAMLPPAHGWTVLNDGAEPAPTLSAIAEGPAAFVVSGAGDAHADGTYRRDGTHEGSPLYVKDNLWLARCRCNWYRWVIGDKSTLNDDVGDLYKSRTCGNAGYPPSSGWELADRGDGREPAPTLTALDALGRPVDLRWAVAETPQPAIVEPVAPGTPPVVVGEMVVTDPY